MVAVLATAAGAQTREVPDPAITPGEARDLAVAQICSTKWGKDERAVTDAMKAHVYQAYGVAVPRVDGRFVFPHLPNGRPAYEVDHLISRELGGADTERNLWPQPYTGPWNAHMKDRLENRLHQEVCAGHLDINEARQIVITDWRVGYRRYFGAAQ